MAPGCFCHIEIEQTLIIGKITSEIQTYIHTPVSYTHLDVYKRQAQVLFCDQSYLGKVKKRIAPDLQISIGKWFTPGLGLRLQYSGLQSKSF